MNYFFHRLKKRFKIPTIKEVKKRAEIPEISNSGKITSRKKIIAMLIINEKSPKVKIRKGKVTNFRIGFIKKLINPKTIPIKIKICQSWVNFIPKYTLFPGMMCNLTPGTNFTAKKIAKIETKICQNKFFI